VLCSAAADSFSQADIIDKVKRSQNAWGLMPSHGMASFVRPAHFMRGTIRGGQLGFPQWLGNYSKVRGPLL
jgi:replication factor C subunit 1